VKKRKREQKEEIGMGFPFVLFWILATGIYGSDPPFDQTKVIFSGVFSNHGVLQRSPASASVFGTAVAGGSVTVTLSGPNGFNFTSAPVIVTTSNDASLNGTWKVLLPPRPAGFGYSLTATCNGCSNDTAATLNDVGFGDVYLCSGQSNMECPLYTTLSRNESYKRAALGLYDHVRLYQTGWRLSNRNESTWVLPLSEPNVGGYPQRTWALPSGDDNGGSLVRFSAVCWYFGAALADAALEADGADLVPIGLIATTVGGTNIQHWMPPWTTSNATCKVNNCGWVEQLNPTRPPVQPATQPSCTNASSANVWSCPSGLCSSLWHGMIAPFANVTISGAIWYQGENNIANGRGDLRTGYACQQAAMIDSWRRVFSATANTTPANFPFGVTTLAGACTEGFPLWSQYEHAIESSWLDCATHGGSRAPGATCKDMVNDWAGGLRAAQTGGFGHTPNPLLQNVFLGQGFDMGEPCLCDRAMTAPNGCWANEQCYGTGFYSLNVTHNYELAAIHPRDKKLIGQRLARALTGLISGKPQSTPKLSRCRLVNATLINLSFDAVLLGGEAVSLQAPPPGSSSPLEFLLGPTGNATWVSASSLKISGPNSISAEIPNLLPSATLPSAVRYAWGDSPCCPGLNASTYFCPPAACPIVTASSLEPAVPFWAAIDAEGKCECTPPWDCSA